MELTEATRSLAQRIIGRFPISLANTLPVRLGEGHIENAQRMRTSDKTIAIIGTYQHQPPGANRRLVVIDAVHAVAALDPEYLVEIVRMRIGASTRSHLAAAESRKHSRWQADARL
jgi:hypothetical protein